MRTLTILRKKHFAGSLIKYFCVINVNKADYLNYNESKTEEENKYSSSSFCISNGEQISIEIDNCKNTLFVVAYTSTGIVFSDEVIIEAGCSSESYQLITKYSFFKGSSYSLIKK